MEEPVPICTIRGQRVHHFYNGFIDGTLGTIATFEQVVISNLHSSPNSSPVAIPGVGTSPRQFFYVFHGYFEDMA